MEPQANQSEDWLVWQLADSAFPTGGFAHSGGLEAAWQHGELRNASELKEFVAQSLIQFGHSSLPFMLAAFDRPQDFLELDFACESFLTNHVANRASRLQGRALMASAERIFTAKKFKHFYSSQNKIQPQTCAASSDMTAHGRAALPRGLTDQPNHAPESCSPHFHLSAVFGVVTNALGLPREKAARVFIFWHLRGLFASAVRLGVVGPMEAQALQDQCACAAEEVLRRCAHITVDEVAQTSPLLEIWQGAQDRLYSRLFQS